MKKYFTLILFISFGYFSIGQTYSEVDIKNTGNELLQEKDGYLPIINSEQTWIGRSSPATAPPSSFQYTYSEDSVSQVSNYYFERIQSNNQDGSEPYIQGYYREIDGMIYQKLEGNFNERIVLDMSLLQGDSITINQDGWSTTLVAVSVDTVTYEDDLPRKRIELQCAQDPEFYGSIYWVEGIGELYYGIACALDGGDGYLACVIDNNESEIYHTSFDDECWLSTSTNEHNISPLVISPNPVSDILYIKNYKHYNQVEIRNMLGQIVKQTHAQSELNISTLPKGNYVITLYSTSASTTKKFIKM